MFGPSRDRPLCAGNHPYIAVAKRPPFPTRRSGVLGAQGAQAQPGAAAQHDRAGDTAESSSSIGSSPKALAKQPQERFTSARQYIEEFVNALDAAPLPLFGEPPAPPPGRSMRQARGAGRVRRSATPANLVPGTDHGTPSWTAAAAAAGSRRSQVETIQQVPQALRTTMPAFRDGGHREAPHREALLPRSRTAKPRTAIRRRGESPVLEPAALKPDSVNPRSIEAWGARAKPAAPAGDKAAAADAAAESGQSQPPAPPARAGSWRT